MLEKNGFKLVFKGIDKYQGEDRELRKYIFEREFKVGGNKNIKL